MEKQSVRFGPRFWRWPVVIGMSVFGLHAAGCGKSTDTNQASMRSEAPARPSESEAVVGYAADGSTDAGVRGDGSVRDDGSRVEAAMEGPRDAMDVSGGAGETDGSSGSPSDRSSGIGSGTEPASPPASVTWEEALVLFRTHRFEEAAQAFDAFAGLHPDNPFAHYMVGLSHWKSGRAEEAAAAFRETLALDPHHVKSRINLARALLDLGRPGEAREAVSRALDQDPQNGEALRVLGRANHELGRREEAIEAYHGALGVDDADVWALNNLGLLLIQMERFEDALGPLARAAELDPDEAVFHNNLGVALERSGWLREAAESYAHVLEIRPEYGKAQENFARVEPLVDTQSREPFDGGAVVAAFLANLPSGDEQASRADAPDSLVVGGVVADRVPGRQDSPR